MKYNKLGNSGLKISELSFGSWLTFGDDLDYKKAKECMKFAFEHGVNFFDNAEAYAGGQSELIMGDVLKNFRREDLVLSTKIFWGGKGPNDKGLSWKHMVEGTKNSLRRLNIDYIDLLFCHRPDPETPIEETVRAIDYLMRAGLVFYWGTSEWSAHLIDQTFELTKTLNIPAPTMEQPQYNLLRRARFEDEYKPLFEKYKLGTTIWSPLASGILTGKYSSGIPKNSRLDKVDWLQKELTPEVMIKVQNLYKIAKNLNITLSQLSIAWCLKNPNVSSVILGATNPKQLAENFKALEIKEQLTDEIMKNISDAVK